MRMPGPPADQPEALMAAADLIDPDDNPLC